MPGGAAVDRRAPAVLVLDNMQGHRLVAQLHHKVAGIVALVGAEGDRLWTIGMRVDQRQGSQALGMSRGAGRHPGDDQTIAVLDQGMADETEPGLLAQPFTIETAVGVGGRGVRVIGSRLAVKVSLARGRVARPSRPLGESF